LFTYKSFPVIFEPPCIIIDCLDREIREDKKEVKMTNGKSV